MENSVRDIVTYLRNKSAEYEAAAALIEKESLFILHDVRNRNGSQERESTLGSVRAYIKARRSSRVKTVAKDLGMSEPYLRELIESRNSGITKGNRGWLKLEGDTL